MEMSMIPGRRSARYELSGVSRRNVSRPDGAERGADDRHLARAERGDELLREARADDHARGERDEREARLDRREPEHALHVQRVEEEHREEARGDDEHRDVPGAHGLDREDREAHERLCGAALDQHEGDEQHGGEREEARAPRAEPQPASAERTIP